MLSGPNIDDPPIIDPNYLDHPDDVRVLVEGLKVLKRMEETEAFKKHDIRVAREELLCGRDHEAFSDGYLECFARDGFSSYDTKFVFGLSRAQKRKSHTKVHTGFNQHLFHARK